jgi:transcriptional regulator with XRE-family HTH domain/ribulose bisphosphate carboxylase small subunit
MTWRSEQDPAFYEAFGRAVATLRTARRMSRNDLADAAGISYSYVAAIEAGSKVPSPGIHSRIAAALGLSDAELARHATDLMTGEHETLASAPMMRMSASRMARPAASFAAAAPTPLPTSGVMAELGPLLDELTAEDRRLVLDLARRLAAARATGPPPAAAPPEPDVDTRGGLYHRFWSQYLARLRSLGLDWADDRRPVTTSWLSLPSPFPGTTIINRFARRRQVRHELHIDGGSRQRNRSVAEALETHRAEIEGLYGAPLEFDDPGTRRTVRIAAHRPGTIGDTAEHDEFVEWLIDHGRRARRLLDGIDDDLATQLFG